MNNSAKMIGAFLGVIVAAALVLFGVQAFNSKQDDDQAAQAPTGSASASHPERITTVEPADNASESLPEDITAPNDRPEHTAEQMVMTMYSYNPREDSSPQDAMKRAERYMTGELKEAAGKDSPSEKRSQIWESWAKSGDIVTTAVLPEDRDFSDESGSVTIVARQTVLGDAGTIPLEPFSVRVHLKKVDGVWLAAGYDLEDGAPTL